MFRNYIKIAWRNLLKYKQQTVVNLVGLISGTVSCLIILVYVYSQFGFDTQHEDASSLYRLRSEVAFKSTTATTNTAGSSPPIAFALKEDYPEVSQACRVVYFGEGWESLIKPDMEHIGFYEPGGYLADSTFFELFNFPFVEGNRKSALDGPNKIVLSSTLSNKLFGEESAVDQTILLETGGEFVPLIVTGVFDSDFGKTHLNPNYILSMNSPGLGAFVNGVQNFATQNFAYSYIRLNEDADASVLEAKLPQFLQARGADDLKAAGFDKKLFLQPVTDINLYSAGISNQIDKVSSIQYIYMLVSLALVIQLVACINFINLSTARANRRAKEIGVRKSVGADRKSLIGQFLGESVVLTTIAASLSVPLVNILLPFINELLESKLALSHLLDFRILTILLFISITTGLLSGIYPAIFLSSIRPVKVLKSVATSQSGNGSLRRVLVVFQFIVSTTLIVAVIVISQQLKFAQQKDMGFSKNNLIALRLGTSELSANYESLRNEFLKIPGVRKAAGTNHYPSEFIFGDLGMHLPGADPTVQTLVYYNGITRNYFNTVGTKLIKGRDLADSDSSQVIVNEATLKAFNIPIEEAVSSKLIQTYEGVSTEYVIVGVVEDYHFKSFKEPINPLLLFNEEQPEWLVLNTETDDVESLLEDLNSEWKEAGSESPLVYNFIDQGVKRMFEEEKRIGNISLVFTLLAILISCLGLFGLISFVAEQKKKEIGIRKVLGAGVDSIVYLLTKDFIKLVLVAFVIATPLAYYFLQGWLQDFAYRVEISWWVFAAAGFMAMVITLLTISVQSVQSALANPTRSLRTD
ncbi:MAG: ABC transporter permease [Bacteroidota bacterium]